MTNAKNKWDGNAESNVAATAGLIAFEGPRCLASGDLAEIVGKVKAAMNNPKHLPVLIFDASSSRQVEIDFRGSVQAVLERLGDYSASGQPRVPGQNRRGPGRPKLGVVGREVTLLPRHWDWLDAQPGGASVALRKLVEEARRSNKEKDRARQSQDAVYRFMSVMAGDLPGFEEALRAFYRGNKETMEDIIRPWPADIRDQIRKLVATADRDHAAAAQPGNPAATRDASPPPSASAG